MASQPKPLQFASPCLAAAGFEAIALALSTSIIGKKKSLAAQGNQALKSKGTRGRKSSRKKINAEKKGEKISANSSGPKFLLRLVHAQLFQRIWDIDGMPWGLILGPRLVDTVPVKTSWLHLCSPHFTDLWIPIAEQIRLRPSSSWGQHEGSRDARVRYV